MALSTQESELPYLSEVLNTCQLKRGRANLIISPCHSGKTTAVAKIFADHKALSHHGLLLIDTTAGRDALLKTNLAQRTPLELAERLNAYSNAASAVDDQFLIMTYYEFGIYAEQIPESLSFINVIICDEIHNLVKYLAIEEAQNKANDPEGLLIDIGGWNLSYASAFRYLSDAATGTVRNTPLVVHMSATPDMFIRKCKETNTPLAIFDYTDVVRSDKTEHTQHYASLPSLLKQVNGKALIYVPTINLIQNFAQVANDGKRKIMSLWSTHNSKYPMSDEQLAVRNYLLQNKRIPDDIDLLFINAAYETSINIENPDINAVVVYSSNPDVQIQARGRLRHDIQTLYLYDPGHRHILEYFPKEYFNSPLSAEEREIIAQEMGLVNAKGRPLKWSSIASLLEKQGCDIVEQRINNRRYYSVQPFAC